MGGPGSGRKKGSGNKKAAQNKNTRLGDMSRKKRIAEINAMKERLAKGK